MTTSPMKMMTGGVASLVRFALHFGCGPQVQECIDLHAELVNPNDLTAPHNISNAIGEHIDRDFQFTSQSILMNMLQPDGKIDERQRPEPDVSKFFIPSEIQTLGKQTELLTPCEEFLKQKTMRPSCQCWRRQATGNILESLIREHSA